MKIKLPKGFFPGREYVFIVAVDPGESVGTASVNLMRCGNKALKGSPYLWDAQFDTQVLHWPTEVARLQDFILAAADVIVVEDWRVRKDKALAVVGQRLYGPEVIGWIVGYLQYKDQLEQLSYQTPASKEGLDNYIRARIDWPVIEHERDALRHLVRYLLRAQDIYR